jgi:hypothetical protein
MSRLFRNLLFRIFRICSLYLLIASSAFAEFDDDARLWQTLGITFHEDASWKVTAVAQSRLFDEGKFLGVRLVAPTLEYKVHPNVNIGATYLLEDARSEPGADFTRLHIFWLHVSPHWQIGNKVNFSMRHVLGLRAIESAADTTISRHRFNLDYRVENGGCLVGVGVGTEVFYNYDTGRVFENRLIPLKLSFKVLANTKLSLYYMAQSKLYPGTSSWETAHVFGQSVSYKF